MTGQKTSTTTVTTIDQVTNVSTTNTANTTYVTHEAGEQVATEPQKTDCDKYPNSLGCSDLGEPEQEPEIPEHEINLGGYANLDSWTGNTPRVCPAPIPIVTSLATFHIPTDKLCNGLDYVRTILLAFAWLFAVRYVARETR